MAGGDHPLIDGMARAGLISPYFQLPVRRVEQEGWVDGTELFLNDDEYLENLVMAYGSGYWGTTNRHVAGSAFIIAYLTRLVWPVIGQYSRDRRVPNVSLDNISFHFAERRIDATALRQPLFAVLPSDVSAGHPDADVVTGDDALYTRLKEWLFDSNLALVVASLHRAAGASMKISRNAVAFACAQAFHQLYSEVEDPLRLVSEANAFFDDPSSIVYKQITMEVFEHRDRRVFLARRLGCCLAWRVERAQGYCSNCILTPRTQQDQLFREMLENLP